MTDEQPFDPRATLFAAQDWCTSLVSGVTDDQLTRSTPCSEFDVRDLLTHIALVFEKITAFGEFQGDPWFGKELSPEQMQEIREGLSAQYVDGRTPAERAELLREQAEAARGFWTDDALLEAPMQLGWGPKLPGHVVAGIYLMECVAHGWDLATATGQNAEAPTAVAETALQMAVSGLPKEPRGMEHGVPFGAVVESAPDAGPTEKMANWTGRTSRG